ncbi:hypothetical protein THAOC_15730, partial [Thalassiosira oceanica]
TKQYRGSPAHVTAILRRPLRGRSSPPSRRCDKVIFKGSTDPIVIYAQDLEPLTAYQQKQTPAITNNLAELLRLTTCDETVQDKYRGLLADAQAKPDSTSELAHREVYDFLFNSYLDRAWTRCRLLCHIWLKSFPADAIVHCLNSSPGCLKWLNTDAKNSRSGVQTCDLKVTGWLPVPSC